MMKAIYGAALAACLLAGCNKPSETATNTVTPANAIENNAAEAMAAPDPATPSDAAGYLAKAGAGDMFEIESSRAVMAKTEDKTVREFAQKMVEAHTGSTAKLKAAASAAGLPVAPPKLAPEQQAALDGIKGADGAAAVTAYLAAQRDAHKAALALHQNYAASGDTPALKTATGEIVPVVQHHIDMLAKMPGA